MSELDPYKLVGAATPVASRPFVWTLGAWGAWLAAIYWTFVIVLILAIEGLDGVGLVFTITPSLLVVFYGLRGFQLLSGKATAARALVALHAIGAAIAVLELVVFKQGVLLLLNTVKAIINAFGFLTALFALVDIRTAEAAAERVAPESHKDV